MLKLCQFVAGRSPRKRNYRTTLDPVWYACFSNLTPLPLFTIWSQGKLLLWTWKQLPLFCLALEEEERHFPVKLDPCLVHSTQMVCYCLLLRVTKLHSVAYSPDILWNPNTDRVQVCLSSESRQQHAFTTIQKSIVILIHYSVMGKFYLQ